MTGRLPDDALLNEFLACAMPRIMERFSPSRVILFGSRVRGSAGPDSDLDMIMVSEAFQNIRFPERMGMVLKSFEFPMHVDILCYTPEEFVIAQRRSPIVRSALDHGFDQIPVAA